MQNKFFGSKLNTVILISLIIFILLALSFMYKNKVVSSSIDQNLKSNADVKSERSMYPFLKQVLNEYPDSIIAKCTLPSDQVYFPVYKDDIVNGKHMIGSIYTVYSPIGSIISECSQNPTAQQASICKELNKANSCKIVYTQAGSNGISIDTYSLKK